MDAKAKLEQFLGIFDEDAQLAHRLSEDAAGPNEASYHAGRSEQAKKYAAMVRAALRAYEGE